MGISVGGFLSPVAASGLVGGNQAKKRESCLSLPLNPAPHEAQLEHKGEAVELLLVPGIAADGERRKTGKGWEVPLSM